MSNPFTLTNEIPRPRVVRHGWGKPRFLADLNPQIDAVRGSTEAMVPPKHLARQVMSMVETLDVSSLEQQYSSLGRHGLHPKRKLAVLIYASLTGIHEASKIERVSKTDVAYRFLTGGHDVSATMMRTFRRENEEFFAAAIEQTVLLAGKQNRLDAKDLAVDSVRLRADASTKSIRTLERSQERLIELAKVDLTTLNEKARETHEKKVAKHRAAVKECIEQNRTSLSVTSPLAGLLKFPSGASLPGHRVTVVVSGTRFRFVVAVLIGSQPTDVGMLAPAALAAQEALVRAGISGPLQIAADAGYRGHSDLQFAIAHRDDVDVLINDPPDPRRNKKKRRGGYYAQADFDFRADGSVHCPAGIPMRGPTKAGRGQSRWHGVGCESCSLRERCTSIETRTVVIDPERWRLHQAIRERMQQEGAEERYRRRIATVEPVFSYIEDAMGFRRVSSRLSQTVRAEILLKILSYNLYRLLFCACDRVAFIEAEFDGQRVHTHAVTIIDLATVPQTYFS